MFIPLFNSNVNTAVLGFKIMALSIKIYIECRVYVHTHILLSSILYLL